VGAAVSGSSGPGEEGETPVSGSLDGISVVDLSWGRAGPMATGQLADHGATVVRVEPPGGDPYRSMVSKAAYDRGKRSVIVDLSSDAGREVLHRLLADADVLVESWQPGVADRLGFGYEAVHERYPRLVYCSISGYGLDGSGRDHPGYESLVAARTGVMAVGGAGADPVFPGVPIGSIGAALLAVIGIMAALVVREDSGIGQRVDTSILDGALSFLNMFWEGLENLPDDVDRPRATTPRRFMMASMLCGDGEYLGIHTGANGSHARLMEALGLSDRVAAAPGNREKSVPLSDEEYRVVTTEVPRLFASRPRAYWLQQLRTHDVCAIPVLRPGEVFDQPQTIHNQIVVELDDAELGTLEQVGVAARMTATPGAVGGPAPRAGQHTEEVLLELGYDAETIGSLRRCGAVD
jgi:crotonobetainyl-CoA:carnitine CoA-transferase CaiB-like acyl-CoA transferase